MKTRRENQSKGEGDLVTAGGKLQPCSTGDSPGAMENYYMEHSLELFPQDIKIGRIYQLVLDPHHQRAAT